MSKEYTNYFEREQAILNYLGKHKYATTEEIIEYTKASPATVRRDFAAMSQKGLLTRARGGIQILESSSSASYMQSTSILTKGDKEKSEIAQYAAKFVNENDTLFIGAGKTCNMFSSAIKDINHLTVITTNLTVVLELANSSNISLSLLGGDIHVGPNFIETISDDTEIARALENLYFDKAFIAVDGLDLESGYTIKNRKQVTLYSHLINSTNQFYVFVNSEKFDTHSFVPIFTLEQVNNIITTKKAPNTYLDYFKEHNKNLYIV